MDNKRNEDHDLIVEILEKCIKVDGYDHVCGYDSAARGIMDELIFPMRVALAEAQAKNTVYESALTNSNFKAIVVQSKGPEMGSIAGGGDEKKG